MNFSINTVESIPRQWLMMGRVLEVLVECTRWHPHQWHWPTKAVYHLPWDRKWDDYLSECATQFYQLEHWENSNTIRKILQEKKRKRIYIWQLERSKTIHTAVVNNCFSNIYLMMSEQVLHLRTVYCWSGCGVSTPQESTTVTIRSQVESTVKIEFYFV